MDFIEAKELLESSTMFMDWRKEHDNDYLVHGFVLLEPGQDKEWQIGYYDPESKKIASFNVGVRIEKSPEEDVFSQDGEVRALDPSKVKVGFADALLKANHVQKEKYSTHIPTKRILILQHLEMGQVWNVTYVTQTFSTLNIKIDAETGDILKDNLVSLFKIEKGDRCS